MRMRWALPGVVAAVGLLLADVAAGAAGPAPKIKGKPLFRWIGQLTGSNRGLQMRAARALSGAPETARPKIIEALIPILKSDRQNDRFAAAQVVGNFGPAAKAAVPALLPMLKGTQFERNRAGAAKALGLILKDSKPSEEIDAVTAELIRLFRDKYSDARREAVRACGVIGPATKAFLPHVVPLLQEHKPGVDKYEGYHVHLDAAWAVARMGPHARMHIDVLISLLHSDGRVNPHVPEAIGCIGAIHENVVPNIVDWLEKMGRDWRHSAASKMAAWVALEKFGAKSAPAVPLLARYLREDVGTAEPPELFLQWFKVLRAIGPKAREALPGLTKWAGVTRAPRGWTKDKLAEVRKAAAATMEELK